MLSRGRSAPLNLLMFFLAISHFPRLRGSQWSHGQGEGVDGIFV